MLCIFSIKLLYNQLEIVVILPLIFQCVLMCLLTVFQPHTISVSVTLLFFSLTLRAAAISFVVVQNISMSLPIYSIYTYHMFTNGSMVDFSFICLSIPFLPLRLYLMARKKTFYSVWKNSTLYVIHMTFYLLHTRIDTSSVMLVGQGTIYQHHGVSMIPFFWFLVGYCFCWGCQCCIIKFDNLSLSLYISFSIYRM